jgi:hypothetical protein
VRARCAGEGDPCRLGPLQASQFVTRGACRGGDAGEEAGDPVDADPQGEAMVKLGRGRPEGSAPAVSSKKSDRWAGK